MKQLIAIILAGQMAVSPAMAETDLPPMTKPEQTKVCQAIIGVDDAYVIAMTLWAMSAVWLAYIRGQERDQLKTKLQQKCGSPS